jgi:hypothetical protein
MNHRRREGKVFTKSDYLSLLGDPNCRCSGAPYIISVDGPVVVQDAKGYGGA